MNQCRCSDRLYIYKKYLNILCINNSKTGHFNNFKILKIYTRKFLML